VIVSTDSLAILLLCSHLSKDAGSEFTPLNLREWNRLAQVIQSASYAPRDLLDLSRADLIKRLAVSQDEADRYASLMDRRDNLVVELERFESKGIRPITCADPFYPQRYRQRLIESAPAVLFSAGNIDLLGQPGIAVVGSRNLDEIGMECAAFVGNACAWSGLVLYSGGARGVDTIAMDAALENRGAVVGILANSLKKAVRVPPIRAALDRGDLCLLTAHAPGAGFSIAAAMGRNKLIYSLADYAIVVASEANKGGTWSGASETIRRAWVPVFVLEHENMPDGNPKLIEKGGIPIPYPFPVKPVELPKWLAEQATQSGTKPSQPELF